MSKVFSEIDPYVRYNNLMLNDSDVDISELIQCVENMKKEDFEIENDEKTTLLSRSGMTVLSNAINFYNVELIKRILEIQEELGFDINVGNPLYIAVANKNVDVVEMLVNNLSVDVNRKNMNDPSHLSPLHILMSFDENETTKEILNILLSREDIDMAVTSKSKRTPIHYCCYKNSAQFLQIIIDSGKDIDFSVRDYRKATPHQNAVEENSFKIINVIKNSKYLDVLKKTDFYAFVG
eukprot:TRINITY_DN139_c2_g1_i1.p1 TRINITY_DN139_c2_g1~~TRINITY_DN139_c2_g1_i1.p1  ORF type:complete len:237 (-),score=60.77 TRINITY_DN139_c2_g1_i1:409-1119(-)